MVRKHFYLPQYQINFLNKLIKEKRVGSTVSEIIRFAIDDLIDKEVILPDISASQSKRKEDNKNG